MKYLLLFLLTAPTLAFSDTLSLQHYLDQVEQKHEQFKAAEANFKAGSLTESEGDLLTATTLFGKASYTDDAKPNLLFNYKKMIDANYQLGLQKQTSIGLSGRLYYNWDDLDYHGLTFTGPPMDVSGFQGSPTLELTLPLWQNFWGGQTKAQVNQLNATKAAQKFSASFEMKNILAQAESAYWQLALARESVKVSKDAVQRATELYKWYQYRSNSGLTDKADLLQSDAALKNRKLDLQTALDNETQAARNFNASRNIDSADVAEELSPMASATLDQLQIPKRSEMRDDTKAALEQSNAARATEIQAREGYKPKLELYGTAALNNDNPGTDADHAFENSFSGTRPTQSVGIRFSTALDLGLIQDAREGHLAAARAADLTYQRKLFEQEKAWHDLTDKFQQAKTRLTIYDQLEKAQKNKLDYERMRRQKGRTTTQWVIQFESEYEQTQLGRIQAMSEILQLFAQLKTFASTEITSR